jgi:hypothetical protein
MGTYCCQPIHKMNITLYKKATLIQFLQVCNNMPEDERDQYEAFSGRKYDVQEAALGFANRSGPNWVLCAGDQPLCIAGFDYIRPGVWQDWMITTPDCWGPYWRSVTKHTKRVMDAMLETEAHRLQCVSLRSRIQAHKWYRVLGLKQDGILPGYGADGQDAILFSRCKVVE